jgi:hypothetical protein
MSKFPLKIEQIISILVIQLLFIGCTNFFKPLIVFKSNSTLLKNYDSSKSIIIENYVFQYYMGFENTEEWKQQWLEADTAFIRFKKAIQTSPQKDKFIFSESAKDVRTNSFKYSAEYNPKLIPQNEIIRLSNTKNGELKLFPLFSYVMYTSDNQFHDIQISDPNIEYIYTLYLHIYLIENSEIIYHQARKLKSFTLYPEDIDFRQRFWNEITASALKPYFKK